MDRLLAAHPALANARDEEGSTPLSAAVDAHRALMFVPEMRSSREFWAGHDIDPGMMAGYAEHALATV